MHTPYLDINSHKKITPHKSNTKIIEDKDIGEIQNSKNKNINHNKQQEYKMYHSTIQAPKTYTIHVKKNTKIRHLTCLTTKTTINTQKIRMLQAQTLLKYTEYFQQKPLLYILNEALEDGTILQNQCKPS